MAHYLYEGLTALGGRGRGGLIGRALRKNYELMTKRREVDMALAVAKEGALAKAGAARLTGEATIGGAELAKEGAIGAAGEYARGYIGSARQRKLGMIGAARLTGKAAEYGAELGLKGELGVAKEARGGAYDVQTLKTEEARRKSITTLLGEGYTLPEIAQLLGGKAPREAGGIGDLTDDELTSLIAAQRDEYEPGDEEAEAEAVSRYFPTDRTPSALEVRQSAEGRLSAVRERIRRAKEYRELY